MATLLETINIIGSVDTNGGFVIKYRYSSFSTLLDITATLRDTLGQDNPYI